MLDWFKGLFVPDPAVLTQVRPIAFNCGISSGPGFLRPFLRAMTGDNGYLRAYKYCRAVLVKLIALESYQTRVFVKCINKRCVSGLFSIER